MRRDLYTIFDTGMYVQDVGGFKDRSSRYLMADWRYRVTSSVKRRKRFPDCLRGWTEKICGFHKPNRYSLRAWCMHSIHASIAPLMLISFG